MKYDDLLKLLRKRVSVRRFDETAVETVAINKLLKAGQRTITGCTANPCHFQIIQNERDRRQIVDFWQEFYRDNFYIEQTRIDALRLPFLRQVETDPPFCERAGFSFWQLATGLYMTKKKFLKLFIITGVEQKLCICMIWQLPLTA